VSGILEGKQVQMMQGRCHWYEGYDIHEVVRPVRILAALGAQTFIITNAAGCLNRQYQIGQFMFITDHINISGINPLRGANIDQFGVRFPDMSTAYDQDLIELGEKVASSQGTLTRRGIYAWYQGPSFETPSEIRLFTMLGADAIGMSTVPEVVVLRHMGRRVLGISCLTNMAAGILPQPITGEEVLETANRVKPQFKALVRGIVQSV
jgi:purine-nucleoside phosphorylase